MKASVEVKAWCVAGDEYSQVVFATAGVVARREGAALLDEDFRNVTCRRAPELDGFAAQGRVLMRVLVEEHDWWTECRWCARRVSRENPRRRWADNDSAWCCAECEAYEENHDRDCAVQEAAEARILAAAVDAAVNKFPGITRVRALRGWQKDIRVYFDFPGGQRDVLWPLDGNTASVVPDEADAFRAYLAGLRREGA